ARGGQGNPEHPLVDGHDFIADRALAGFDHAQVRPGEVGAPRHLGEAQPGTFPRGPQVCPGCHQRPPAVNTCERPKSSDHYVSRRSYWEQPSGSMPGHGITPSCGVSRRWANPSTSAETPASIGCNTGERPRCAQQTPGTTPIQRLD